MSDDFNRIVFELVFFNGPYGIMLRRHGDGQYTLSKYGHSEKIYLSPEELGCIRDAIKAAEINETRIL